MKPNKFPENFIFGASASDYQIVGTDNGEKAENKWMTWEKKFQPGFDGSVACDYYNRFEEDHSIMKKHNLSAFRFEISFTRIFPNMDSDVPSKESIKWYHTIIDDLIKKGITPYVCLSHFDHPTKWYEHGEWANKEMYNKFLKFIDVVVKEYASKVKYWAAFNEPGGAANRHLVEMNYSWFLYKDDEILKHDWEKFVKAVHHMNMSHAYLYKKIKEFDKKIQVGCILQPHPYTYVPAGSKKDVQACQDYVNFHEEVFIGPHIEGKYSDEVIELFSRMLGRKWSPSEVDKSLITKSKSDFIGFNLYNSGRIFVKAKTQKPTPASPRPFIDSVSPPKTANNYSYPGDYGWNRSHNGVVDFFWWCIKRWGNKIDYYITECGIPLDDKVTENKVFDYARVKYVKTLFQSCLKAVNLGINLKGVFLWSLLDNLEWDLGYKTRFGMVHVDFETQKRTPKMSLAYVAEMAETKMIPEGDVEYDNKIASSAVNL